MFLRNISFMMLLFGLALFSGCCADDRDYIRNHVARQNRAPVLRNAPSEHGTNVVAVLVATGALETAPSK